MYVTGPYRLHGVHTSVQRGPVAFAYPGQAGEAKLPESLRFPSRCSGYPPEADKSGHYIGREVGAVLSDSPAKCGVVTFPVMNSKAAYCVAYMTASTAAEARRIGRALVSEELAACVNVLGPVESVYRWKGRVERGREVAFIAKTRVALQGKFVARVRALHSYECPCVVFLPVEGGNPAFLTWLGESTGAGRQSRRPPRTPARIRK